MADMKPPIQRASLSDLLCVVQSGSGYILSNGQLAYPDQAVSIAERITEDHAEAEIERRFAALERKVKRLEARNKRLAEWNEGTDRLLHGESKPKRTGQ